MIILNNTLDDSGGFNGAATSGGFKSLILDLKPHKW
jgi:hypothetical protein